MSKLNNVCQYKAFSQVCFLSYLLVFSHFKDLILSKGGEGESAEGGEMGKMVLNGSKWSEMVKGWKGGRV
jgi:hypothetical protein